MTTTDPAGADAPPRGHNQPPPDAQDVTDRMAREYAGTFEDAAKLLADARALPGEVTDDDVLKRYAGAIVDLRDAWNKAESHRKAEKTPYDRAADAVHGFFKEIQDRLAQGKTVLDRRVDAYQDAKAKREQAERRRAFEEAQRAERERQQEAERQRLAAEKATRDAAEAAAAAERARNPQRIEEKTAVAEDLAGEAREQRVVADEARVGLLIAQEATDQAAVEAARPAADLTRARFETGRIATTASVGYADVVDHDKLDKEKLWPFITADAKEKALRAWARSTNYKEQMDGAAIGRRNKGVVR